MIGHQFTSLGPLPLSEGFSTTTTVMPAALEVAVHVFHRHSFCPPLEPIPNPFLPQACMIESDSDMDSEPHLSEALTETDNDTPPETPLRPTMEMDNGDHFVKREAKELELEDSSCSRTPVMPAPAHFSEPLHLATPNPIRPVPHAIRLFGCTKLDEEDKGYDSEREGRPGLPRLRSFQLSNASQDKTCMKRPGLPRRAASFIIGHSGERISTDTPRSGLQSSPRPRQSSPLVPLDTNQPVLDMINWSTRPLTLEEIFGHPLSPEEEALLLSDLIAHPLENLDVPAPAKDRSNEATGLGLGLPVSLEGDTWRIPTVVPRQPNTESPPPECANTPSISPIHCDDLDLSPLSLPAPLISPAMTDWSRWDAFSEVEDRILYALETGTWSDESLVGVHPTL
ncbi:hypothetical protein OPQ81_002173 [Rhizoctonia solani]|nr:hypothetical protein OPQ81_011146 [Rhizoctonia solani]KAJ1308111.1 hypothetical protein OPQ81_002173 [Rhizoctonia solani]